MVRESAQGRGGQTKVVAARDRASPKGETKMKDMLGIGDPGMDLSEVSVVKNEEEK